MSSNNLTNRQESKSMSGVNKVILIGNLGSDPELKTFAGGGGVVNVSIATSEKWKDKNNGEQKEKTEWHRIVFYNKLAEVVAKYLKKGNKIYVEGRLQTREYTDKSGITKYITEIVAREMQMLRGKDDRAADALAPAPAGKIDAAFNEDIPF